jgi:hypothetical protein
MNARLAPILAGVIVLAAAAAGAEESISPETLRDIKDATVYVKVEAEGDSGSGSGFVIRIDGNSALVVTNHHVIEPKIIEVEIGGRGGGPMFRRPPFAPPSPFFSPRITTSMIFGSITW